MTNGESNQWPISQIKTLRNIDNWKEKGTMIQDQEKDTLFVCVIDAVLQDPFINACVYILSLWNVWH